MQPIVIISVKYYPQGDYQEFEVKFRNASVTRKVAELLVIFADLGPDECKNATPGDEVLEMVSLIPQDLWMRSAEFFKEQLGCVERSRIATGLPQSAIEWLLACVNM